jgi:hypothetical protein
MFLNQFADKSNHSREKAVGTGNQENSADFQEAASPNSWARSSLRPWVCGQPEQQDLAHGPSASSMMALMVRAQRPHSALHPRQP